MQTAEITPRKLILSVLAGGPLLGLLMGVAAAPEMTAPPEPSWRKLQPDPIFRESQRLVDAGPQDLSPTWYLDRMPTWKRRAIEAERQAAMQAAAYYPLAHAEEPEPALPEPAAAVASRQPAPEPGPGPAPALEDAAPQLAADRDARAAPAAEAAVQQEVLTVTAAEAGA